MATNPWQVNLMLNNYHICKTVLEDLLAKIIPGPEVTVFEPEITVSPPEVTLSEPEVAVSEPDDIVPELEAKYPRTKVTFLDQPELEKWARVLKL